MRTASKFAPPSTVESTVAYTGVDNLEIMEEAVRYNRFLLEVIIANTDGAQEVIDFGAGCGTFSTLMRDRGFSVTSIEPDDALRARLKSKGLKVRASADELPDAGAPYVFSLNVLEHIEDDLAALQVLHRKLRAGGRLLIYVPAFQLLYTSMDRKVGHYRRYRRDELAARLAEAGFEVELARYVDSIGFAATLVFKMLDRGNGAINMRALRLYDRLIFPLSLILDKLLHRVLGKNILVVAKRP